MRVSLKERTAAPGGQVWLPGDVIEIPDEAFDATRHTAVPDATPLSTPHPWDTE